jgi:hypothetical protein
MGKDLIFPKSTDDKEDPAILSARKTLQRGGARGRKPHCFVCQGEFTSEELVSAYSKVYSRMAKFCPKCLPHKNDYTYISGFDPEVLPPASSTEFKYDVDEVAAVSAVITKLPPPVKECMSCDSNLFYLLRGSVVKCSKCGQEYRIGI